MSINILLMSIIIANINVSVYSIIIQYNTILM